MKKKQLIINLCSNILSFSSSLLISFILTPFLIKNIGKEAYSFFPMSNNFVGYLTIMTLALNSMAARYISIEIHKKDFSKAKTYYSSVFFSNLIMIAVLILPTFFFIYFLEKILNIPIELIIEVKVLFTLVFMSMFIELITTVFGVSTFATDRLDLRSISEIVRGILRLLLFLFLFSSYKPSIVFIGIVSLVMSLYNLFIQIIFTKKLLPGFRVSIKKFEFQAIKILVMSGMWNTISSLGVSLLLGMSLLLTNYFIGVTAAGNLSIAIMLPGFITGIISMIVSVFLPRLTKIYVEGTIQDLEDEVLFSQKLLGLFTTVPICLLIIFGENFFRLWVPSEYSQLLPTLSLILLSPLFIHGNMWSIYSMNIILNKVKIPSLVLVVCGIGNLIISIILLKVFENNIMVIPLVTSAINILYYFFFIPFYTADKMKIKKFIIYKHLLKSIAFISIFINVAKVIKDFIIINSWIDFFLWGGIFGVVGLMFNVIIILNKEEKKNIYKYIKKRC